MILSYKLTTKLFFQARRKIKKLRVWCSIYPLSISLRTSDPLVFHRRPLWTFHSRRVSVASLRAQRRSIPKKLFHEFYLVFHIGQTGHIGVHINWHMYILQTKIDFLQQKMILVKSLRALRGSNPLLFKSQTSV